MKNKHSRECKIFINKKEVKTNKLPLMPYRKKPIIIYACDIWKPFEVHTLERIMRGEPGDMLIRGIEGEFYPCKVGIFNKTYESITFPRQLKALLQPVPEEKREEIVKRYKILFHDVAESNIEPLIRKLMKELKESSDER